MAFGRFRRLIPGTGVQTVDNGDETFTLNVTGAPPTGAAGGGLGGTYPNPTVDADVLTTAGDLLTQDVNGTYVRRGIGSTDQVLAVVAGLVAWQTRIKSLKKTGGSALTGDVGLSEGANVTITPSGQDLIIAATITGGGAVDSIAVQGDTPMVGDIELAAGSGITLSQDDVDTLTIAASGGASDGWQDDTGATWTRTGNQTFTVTGDRTAVFQKGTYLKWTQTTVKYGIVESVSHAAGTTTVTIMTNTDYVLTAAAISANYYSYQLNPQGWPGWFNYTPTLTASVSNPTLGSGSTAVAKYARVGNTIFVRVFIGFGTSGVAAGSGNYRISLPSPSNTAVATVAGQAFIIDSSASSLGRVCMGDWAGGTYAQMWVDSASNTYVTAAAPWTWAASDLIWLWGTYEAA